MTEEVLTLRPYQYEGVGMIVSQRRLILADEMGLGKTVQVLKAVVGNKQTLVVCPRAATGVWVREAKRWLDIEPMVFTGDLKTKDRLIEQYVTAEEPPSMVICTYNALRYVRLFKRVWDAIVYDEAHHMRNRKSKAFEFARDLTGRSIVHVTGSPIVNHMMDLWPLLYLIDRKRFSSYWKFAEHHCTIIKNHFGGREISGPKNPIGSRAELKPYILRRLKKNVLPELPEKVRKAIPLEMTDIQREMYDAIALEKLYQLENGEIIVAPNKMSELVRLRQLLVTPALLGGPNSSVALDALAELASENFLARQPVSTYVPFAKALLFIAEKLAKAGAKEIYTIHGGMSEKAIAQTEDAFRASKTPQRAIIISLLSATSFSIESCSNGYFLGSHWNPTVNIQAEDRMHRMTSKDMVVCNYFQHQGTVDEHVLDIVNKKLTWSHLILDPERLLFGSRKGQVRAKS